MLTYDDCVGLSELRPEEVAAIARHEHLTEIAALCLGSSLLGTEGGKHAIQRMILETIEDACKRGDVQAAGQLGAELHRYIDTHLDRNRLMTQRVDNATPAAGWHEAGRGHTEYLETMLRHFGIDAAAARERFGPEMQIAEMCCAACTETRRCDRFLHGRADADSPLAFCPNAPLFEQLKVRAE